MQVALAWRGRDASPKSIRRPAGPGVALQPTLHTSQGIFTDIDATIPAGPGSVRSQGGLSQKDVDTAVARVSTVTRLTHLESPFCHCIPSWLSWLNLRCNAMHQDAFVRVH